MLISRVYIIDLNPLLPGLGEGVWVPSIIRPPEISTRFVCIGMIQITSVTKEEIVRTFIGKCSTQASSVSDISDGGVDLQIHVRVPPEVDLNSCSIGCIQLLSNKYCTLLQSYRLNKLHLSNIHNYDQLYEKARHFLFTFYFDILKKYVLNLTLYK